MPDSMLLVDWTGYAWILWLGAFILCLVLECVTPGALVSIWLAVGAFVTMLCSFGVRSFGLQVVIFLIVSFATFALIRPVAKKFFSPKLEPTNADRLVGETAVVTQTIDNLAAAGQVQLKGRLWTARNAEDAPIEEGTHVRVLRIEGAKVIVAVEKPKGE